MGNAMRRPGDRRPQDIWRMPATDEVLRSLVRRGENAGAEWNGKLGRMSFHVMPDKETPSGGGMSRRSVYGRRTSTTPKTLTM